MKLNRTLLRSIEILELISKSKDGYTLAEIVEIVQAPKSSVFDILKTLVHTSMLEEEFSNGKFRYKIGLHSFLIGSNYVNGVDTVKVAKRYLNPLADRMKATTFMAILDDYKVTYLYKYESKDSIITTANIGSRRELHSASLGKIMLAYSSQEFVDEAIKHINFEPYTEYTITSIEKYYEVLKEAKIKGYAKSDREDALHQIAVAAPIFDHTGQVIAAISCVGLYQESIDLDELGEIVKKEAKNISYRLGYLK
ncbi:IclR family transcriptional regulator [Clostridium sp. AL.422]|uniref:IclR family transcriptional regulator n=1 Tax=Clostridium TaxID=1485 RepID=UPI00293DC420|nr:MULTISPECIES: IclR family transcriptional regulator [unclassified Clostridium]MDV4149430.1 IclR family transcriptional regulator [Clostridium sp. AL.422]